MNKALKCRGSADTIVANGLRSYKAAIIQLGCEQKQAIGRWANNRVENSHLSFRRKERAMLRFRRIKNLQKLASVHDHFSSDRYLIDRQTYKTRRSAALAEWQYSWPDPARGRRELRQVETSFGENDST